MLAGKNFKEVKSKKKSKFSRAEHPMCHLVEDISTERGEEGHVVPL